MIDRLHYISAPKADKGHYSMIAEALNAGSKWIQLRMKNTPVDEMETTIIETKKLCEAYNAKLILNDHVEFVKKYELDGVHIGKEDMKPSDARAILGSEYIIGSTANTIEDIQGLSNEPIDYIGLGPYQFTTTKENLSPVLGVDGYLTILKEMHHMNIDIPVIAIGGIELSDVNKINSTGVHGIAVSGLVNNAQDKEGLIASLYQILDKPPIK